jgi:hypothetical protein
MVSQNGAQKNKKIDIFLRYGIGNLCRKVRTFSANPLKGMDFHAIDPLR